MSSVLWKPRVFRYQFFLHVNSKFDLTTAIYSVLLFWCKSFRELTRYSPVMLPILRILIRETY